MAYVFAALLEYAIANYLNRQRSETASKLPSSNFYILVIPCGRKLEIVKSFSIEAIFQAYFFEIQFEHQR